MAPDPPKFMDHFSVQATEYARSRPGYPAELFDWIASIAPARSVVWDCATGSGQAALPLAERFDRVIATDASAAQLAQAPAHPRIEWRVAPAEESGLDDGSMDAVTVAQALHWFDQSRFWSEVRRVLRPGGLVVAWSYGKQQVSDAAIAAALNHFHDDVVGLYWPKERWDVDQRYVAIDFPFERITPPDIPMQVNWPLERLLGYVRSWSATQRFIAARGTDPLPMLAAELTPLWGNGTRPVSWPLTILAGRTAG